MTSLVLFAFINNDYFEEMIRRDPASVEEIVSCPRVADWQLIENLDEAHSCCEETPEGDSPVANTRYAVITPTTLPEAPYRSSQRKTP